MNDLRWILLIAGALLIAGIYFWGLRTRSRNAADREARRPAVFSGGGNTFESPASGERASVPGDADTPASAASVTRRIEPSVSLDDDIETTPAIERRGEFREVTDDRDGAAPTAIPPPRSRREPTLTGRAEPAATARPDTYAAPRPEPTLTTRAEPIAPEAPRPATPVRTERPAPARTERAPADEMRTAASPAAAAAPVTSPTPAHVAASAPAPAQAPTATESTTTADTVKTKRPPQKIFAVRVTAAASSRITGDRILEALQAEGLQFGKYQIFHRLHDNGRPLFSVASLRDPGTFDLQEMPLLQYPGVLVFAVLPGPASASEAFDEMLFTARALATHLGGALADEQGTPLTAHRAGRLREEALEFERTVLGAA
ncbi:MAG TPA: cell division protein ZipA C-terminal FtsZ-binding domain-containing protein [Steroidobacteraceae bacterium]|nr:cell division protein ZipA C-terminal FtsZ-binding domain-containing protein [Steroidobacteraceae bacterium]